MINNKTIFKACGCLVWFSILTMLPIQAFIIDRVILASNENRMYLDFWPLVSQAWYKLIGIKPTLILISHEDINVDQTYGEVIRVKPIEGVPTATHAQVIRLLAPLFFENEISIISDIDMLPLNKDYFVNSVKEIPDDTFVVYRDKGYGPRTMRFPLCYSAGKGYLFKQIFKITSVDDIPATIYEWTQKGYGWATDEIMLNNYVFRWKQSHNNCIFLGGTSMLAQRIDRANWGYDKIKLKNHYYIDAHMVRPLEEHYNEIKELADDLGLTI